MSVVQIRVLNNYLFVDGMQHIRLDIQNRRLTFEDLGLVAECNSILFGFGLGFGAFRCAG